MIFVYVLLRAVGKILGSWFGAKYCGAPLVVRKYLGICLLPQAGVAIGLVILASGQFESSLGHEIIMVVMMATFLMEIFGPMLVKVGVKGAGEVGLNITEEDLIKTYKVGDVMEREPTSIAEDLPLHQILEVFSTSDSVYYPVIDSRSQITGKITIAGIKEMFANQDVAGWLLACDVAEPVLDKTTSEKSLEEVVELMRHYDLEHIPVVADEENNRLVGVLDYRRVLRKISTEVLHRRKQADEMALGTV
jgi:CBS domain-containing protein